MNSLDLLSEKYVQKMTERFEAKYDRGSEDDCWEWGATISPQGYGMFSVKSETTTAHRVAWSLRYGPIPQDHVIDHLCGNKPCVNPKHLDAVKQRVNFMRGEHSHAEAKINGTCASGEHLLKGDNVKYMNGDTNRTCRECYNSRRRERNAWRRSQGLHPT